MLLRKRERLIRRILIVEDEPLVAFDNERLLVDEGYEVVATVDTVADAVRIIGEEELHLVLTDLTLAGGGDGTDVARAAMARSIPALFVSGSCPVDARSLAIGCLTKPYSDKMLKAALASIEKMLLGEMPKKVPGGLSLYAPSC